MLPGRGRVSPTALHRAALLFVFVLWCGLIGPYLPLIGRGGDAVSLAIAGRLVAEGRSDALYAQSPNATLAVEDPAWIAEASELGYEWRLYPYLYLRGMIPTRPVVLPTLLARW